jgi:hypothetical protein
VRKPSYLARISERREPAGAMLVPPRLQFRPTPASFATILESEPGRPTAAAMSRAGLRESVDMTATTPGAPAMPLVPHPPAPPQRSRRLAAPLSPAHALDATSLPELSAPPVAPAMTLRPAAPRPVRQQTPAAPPPSAAPPTDEPPQRSAMIATTLSPPRPRAVAPPPRPATEAVAPSGLALAQVELHPPPDARSAQRRAGPAQVVAFEQPARQLDPAPRRESAGLQLRAPLAPPALGERRSPPKPASADLAARSKGGVLIGTLEVKIVPPPAPVARPAAPLRPAAAPLSRGFRAFGLTQS